MTREDIIRMARDIGAGEPESLYGRTDYVVMTKHELERFAAFVAAAEREECAKVCEEHWRYNGNAMECADAIRARGEAPAQIGEQFMHVTDGIYEENGEIKSGTIPDHIVQADQARSAPATRAYYAKAIERANQFTESLRQERLKREAGDSGDE